MGVLDVAGRQERFSAKTYTTRTVSTLKEGRFFESIANHLVELELHGSYYLWCLCRLFYQKPVIVSANQIDPYPTPRSTHDYERISTPISGTRM